MLKQWSGGVFFSRQHPAAFRRLCVETALYDARRQIRPAQPPSGGCVLKQAMSLSVYALADPAAFRRLCVETLPISPLDFAVRASRLQAAVC